MRSTAFAMRSLRIAMVVALGCAAGCRENMPDGPRIPTTPVTGVVMVDGKPAETLLVKCEPVGEAKPGIPTSSSFTDKDGKFTISTFESGDGAPPGQYKLVFFWGQINLLNGQYGGKDKLNNRYRKPADSPKEITVAESAIDVGTIELKTK